MTAFTESVVENATLEWFGELGYRVIHGPEIAPGEPAAERESYEQVVLEGRLREVCSSWSLSSKQPWNPRLPPLTYSAQSPSVREA